MCTWINKILSFQGLPDLAEIYPLGGSADRLGLVDPNTGECLPAAMLPYCGRTLLEGLIRDLQVLDHQLSNTELYFMRSLLDNKNKTRLIIYDGH